MAPSLLAQGLTLMLVGMGTVFVFLTLLVLAMSLMSRIVGRIVSTGDVDGDGPTADEVAAISAAVHEHRKGR